MTLVAFTGTRYDLPAAQVAALARVLRDLAPSRLAHGCAQGADEMAWRIARAMGVPVDHYPGVGAGGSRVWRGACDVQPGDLAHAEAPMLRRNRAIVDTGDVLVACPREERGEALRSGTWSCVRYARRVGRDIVIVRPSGAVERE